MNHYYVDSRCVIWSRYDSVKDSFKTKSLTSVEIISEVKAIFLQDDYSENKIYPIHLSKFNSRRIPVESLCQTQLFSEIQIF